jgi:hypothetical protein
MVMADGPDIRILRELIDRKDLAHFVGQPFSDMVKYVADVQRGIVAIGGELHADAEQILLADGSRQADLWGANYYPGRGPDECIEFTFLINIRPALGNPSMLVADPALRDRIKAITSALIGRGEALQ